jgi:hypothetical protein
MLRRMSNSSSSDDSDVIVARLLRVSSGLRAGGGADGHEVLVTYHGEQGDRPFAICRDGILIEPEGSARLVPFLDIEDTSYFDRPSLEGEKEARRYGHPIATSLPLKLTTGEVLVLRLATRLTSSISTATTCDKGRSIGGGF